MTGRRPPRLPPMPDPVRIGDRLVGPGQPCYVVGEIGINHNGDLDLARKLISAAALASCDAVKFQKRTVDVVYSAEELARPRESPFGDTNGDLKHGLEFDEDDYRAIADYCGIHGLPWYASCWDSASVDVIEQFDPPCYKIASASLTDDALLRRHRETGKPLVLSTGMSSVEEIDHALEVLGAADLVLLHTTSTYPAAVEELNLSAIATLRERYGVPVGYSGHEVGLAPSLAAAALGACMIERHITLDRAMWGSDQAASVEPHGIARLVRDIRTVESAMGDGVKRVYESELPVLEKLRRDPSGR
jgi:N-acetylneuraminate synthase